MTALGVRTVQPFFAMEVAREANRRAAAGQSIVRFDVGQPDWGAPPAALEAAQKALTQDRLGYTDALGDPRLRAALSTWYARVHGVAAPAERIVITTGASGGFQLAFLAMLADGDGVVMARPGYPPYRHILTALGFTAHEIAAEAADGFQLTAAMVASAPPRTAAALIASPANPTGGLIREDALAMLAHACRTRGMRLISDEIYHGLTDETPACTALRHDRDAIVINSFSKYWAMTGWRVGWMVAPEALIAPIERLAQNLTICPPSLAQIAATGALAADDWCQARARTISANRARLRAALAPLGLREAAHSDGAFYLLLDISAHSDDSRAFCADALNIAGVALTPGIDFDPVRGGHWVRLSFARQPTDIETGLARLADWLGSPRR